LRGLLSEVPIVLSAKRIVLPRSSYCELRRDDERSRGWSTMRALAAASLGTDVDLSSTL